MKKILPIVTNCTLSSYPYFSNYLGALTANKKIVDNLIINNFFNIRYVPFKGKVFFLNRDKIKRQLNPLVFNYPIINPIHFVIENINKNKYINMVLNLENINFDDGFHIPDDKHCWLIYGYDSDKQLVYMVGYLQKNEINVYRTFTISFDDFISSIPNSTDCCKEWINNIMYNHTFSIDNYKDEELDLKKIKKKILINLLFVPFFNNNVYSCLILHIKFVMLFSYYPKRSIIDMRDYKTIYERINILLKIYKSLKISNYQLDKCFNLKKEVLDLILLISKNQTCSSKICLTKVIKKLLIIKKHERKYLLTIYKEIKKKTHKIL